MEFHQHKSLATNTYLLSVPTDQAIFNYDVADASEICRPLFGQWNVPAASGFELGVDETGLRFFDYDGNQLWANDLQQLTKGLAYVDDEYQTMVNDLSVGNGGQGFMTNTFAQGAQRITNNFSFVDPTPNAHYQQARWGAAKSFDWPEYA